MENIRIKGSSLEPNIDFDFEKGMFKISGRLVSVASSNNKFFIPLIDSISEYCKNPCPETRIILNFEFCSSSGFKNIFQVLKVFDILYAEGKSVSFEWHFASDDEDGRDKGLYIKRLVNMPVKMVVYTNE